MEELKEIIVPREYAQIRLDQALSVLFPSFSRAAMQQQIDAARVFVNGRIQKKRYLVQEGDTLTLSIPPQEPSLLIPENMTFSVLFEDTDLFAINKPPHLVVHPAPGNRSGTFVHGFLAHLQNVAFDDPVRPGIIHRLDKDTSGVLLAAKNKEALYAVSKQFHDREVKKEYIAVVVGEFSGYKDVEGGIGRDPTNRKRMALCMKGKAARTEVFGLKVSNGFSLIRAIPHTGRTHQVRVHLRSLNLSILGDDLYGQKEVNKKWGVRQMLHCSSLTFGHPKSLESICLQAPFFADMEAVLEKLGFK